MQSSRESYPSATYYEIGAGQAAAEQQAQMHPIVCPGGAVHQLQDILPGSVFGDPSMGHLHYHIIPSRRPGEPGPRSHSRLEQLHHQHCAPRPRAQLPLRPPSSLDERDRPAEHLDRYAHLALDRRDKPKNIGLLELSSDSQASITGSKGKCQCHTLQTQQMQPATLRLKRDSDTSGLEDNTSSGQSREPPALPPRPPPRPSSRRYELPSTTDTEQRHVGSEGGGGGGCCKKYVVLCCLCGGLSAAVGSLFLAVHAVLSAHTASLALFETVPSYIPGTMLIFMGLFTMLLARRKHRYGFLIKVCGSVSVVCALVCVLVTVTTTVVHMSRLQGLRECVYTARAKSCTCYGAPQSRESDPGVLFEGTPHCEAVHGALYACLRALFGVSVAGILACIFSCMLLWQLVNHEKKKMYWEQLELRCRSLYGQGAAAGLVGARPAGTCGCCNDCGGIGPWWAQSPGNLYTPNPDLAPSRRWRLPWSRSRGATPSAVDANYGFHGQQQGGPGLQHQPEAGALMDGQIVPYGIHLGHHHGQPANAYSVLQAAAAHREELAYAQAGGPGPYGVLESAVPLWGPPPPYSDPNSPARRPMLAFPQPDPRARLTKRIDAFPLREVDYSRSSEIKRPSGNYENTEQISNDTDTEPSENCEGRAPRSNKHKKLLKGVENAGFQPQESTGAPKQSESELYFGDVSSCCGPESSLYDVATEKDNKSEGLQSEAGTSSLSCAAQPKRGSSKRSRRHQQPASPDVADLPSNSSCSSDELPAAANGSFALHTSADVEYEVIRQSRCGAGRYATESPSDEYSEQQQQQQQQQQAQPDGPDEPAEPEARDGFEQDVRAVNV